MGFMREDASVLVRHTETEVSMALSNYAREFTAGGSVLVRPIEAYEGLERVMDCLREQSRNPLFVTDLSSHQQRLDSVVGSTGEGEQALPPLESLVAFHTSGSTGSPSCVVYKKETLIEHARVIASSLDLSDSQIYVALPPPRFAYGLSIVDSHLVSGVPVTFADAVWGLPGLSAAVTQADAEVPDQVRDIAIYALPQHMPLLLSADVDPQRVTRIFVAGGRISATSVARLAERFPRLRLTNMYGQAEMGPRISVWDGDPADFVEGMVGSALPGVSMRVAFKEHEDADEVGRLVVASKFAMDRVLRAPYTSVAAGPGAEEVVTSDVAVVAADGSVRHAGRADSVLNVAGTKVDLRRVSEIVAAAAQPLVLKIRSRPGTVSGDDIPVVEIVPGPETPERAGPIRRALHSEFGKLAGLFDIRFVRELTLKESGK